MFTLFFKNITMIRQEEGAMWPLSLTVRTTKKKTTMCTIRLTKTVLSAYENKRFWVNAYESHAYGHPDIQHLSGANDCTK